MLQKHAREMWSKTKSPVWLVAALSGLGLRLQDDKELYDAANTISESSPAYLTCKFYVIDSLLSNGNRAEARKVLQPILAATNLPPTTRNLFSMQMAASSESMPEYLKYSVLNAPEVVGSSSDLVSTKFQQREAVNIFQTDTPALDSDMAADMSRNAPFSTWMQFAQSQNIPAGFKPVIVRTAWTRAQLLQKNNEATKLEPVLAATNPSLAAAVTKIKKCARWSVRVSSPQLVWCCEITDFRHISEVVLNATANHLENSTITTIIFGSPLQTMKSHRIRTTTTPTTRWLVMWAIVKYETR